MTPLAAQAASCSRSGVLCEATLKPAEVPCPIAKYSGLASIRGSGRSQRDLGEVTITYLPPSASIREQVRSGQTPALSKRTSYVVPLDVSSRAASSRV